MYKVGDRFIIEIEEVFTGKATGYPQYRIRGFDKLVMDDRGLVRLSKFDERSIYDKGYKGGLNDAWDVVKKIIEPAYDGGYSFDVLHKIFCESAIRSILKHNTAAEAIAKIKAYEDKQKQDAEIKVGDEIIIHNKADEEIYKAAVIDIDTNEGLWAFDENGCIIVIEPDRYLGEEANTEVKKTNRTFPQIAEVLAELKGVRYDEKNYKKF